MSMQLTAHGPLGDHIAKVAAGLFYREGIHQVGVDRVASEAEVTKRTLYRYFRSKDELIVAALKRGPRVRFPVDGAPVERMLGAFDALIAFLEAGSLRGCPFINAAAELNDPHHPGRAIVQRATARRRAWFCDLARQAGVPAEALLGEQLDVLFDGALAGSMMANDPAPARAALVAARCVIDAARNQRQRSNSKVGLSV